MIGIIFILFPVMYGKLAYASFTGVARTQEKPYIRVIINEKESIFDIHGPWINYTYTYSTQKMNNSFETLSDEGLELYNKHQKSVFEANADNAPENAQEILNDVFYKKILILNEWNYMIKRYNHNKIYFYYDGYVFKEEPLMSNYIEIFYKYTKGDFPIKKSKEWLIVNEGIYDFINFTNAEAGNHILIYLDELTKEQYDDYDGSPVVLIGMVTGKIEKIIQDKRQVYITGNYYVPEDN